MTERPDEEPPSPDEPSSFFTRWGWPLFGLLAFAVFEMTASLSWSALVFALRFGWSRAYSGWFLWKSDPITKRGLSIALMHLAAGMIRIFWGSVGIMLLGAALLPVNRNGGILAMLQLLARIPGIVTLAGVLLALLGGTMAWIGRVPLWVDPASYYSAVGGLWPPKHFRFNQCGSIWATVIVVIALASFPLCLFLAFVLSEQLPVDMQVGAMALGMIISMLGLILFFSWLHQQAKHYTCAITPEECWPELVNRQRGKPLTHWEGRD